MALPIFHVRPGDVITSAFMNALIDQMQGLDARVTQLEGSATGAGVVQITQLIPSAPVRIGDDIEILGANFDFSVGAQRVYFGSTSATIFRAGSTDSRLIVQVPNVPNVSPSGTSVTLLVTNRTSSASRAVTLLPVMQQGNVFIGYGGVSPTTLTPGQATSAIFSYSLDCETLQPITVTIVPTISVSNWQPLLQVVDSSGNILPNGTMGLAPGQKMQFSINLPSLPTPAGSPSSFTLTVAVTGPGIAGNVEGPRTFQFGANQNPDTSITLSPNGAVNPDGSPASPSTFDTKTNTVTLSVGGTVTLLLKAMFTQDGQYDLTPSLAPGTTGWTATLNKSADFNTLPTIQISGATASTPKPAFAAMDVTAPAGASATGQALFTVQRQNAPTNQTATFRLVLG